MSDRGGLGHYLNEAQEYLDAGNIDKSLQTANKALEIAELNEDIGSIVRAKYILSQSYYERNDKNNSLKLAMEAVKDARTSKSERHIAYANLALAKAYFLNNKSDQAEVILHDGLAKARQNKFGDIKVKMLEFSALIDSSHSGLETFEGKDDLDKSEKRNVIEQTQKQFDDDFGPGKISIDIQETEDKMDEIPSNSSQEESDLENDSIGEDPNAQLITDKSFDANITAIEDLGLGYEDYANAFESFLIESKDASPIVIGLHGEWGRGKTTLMESIQKKLQKKGFKTHWLNAWKYDNEENIWGALLNKLIESVFKDLKIYKKLLFYYQLYRYKYFISLLVLSFIAFATYTLFPNIFNNSPFFTILLISGAVLLSFTRFVHKIGASFGLNFKRLFGRIGDNFKLGIVGIVEKDLNNFQYIYKKYSSDTKPIVVFIDDLDRCPPEKIVLVVNAINTLTLQNGFVFFVGYDRDFVAAAISSQYGDIIKYSKEYKIDDPKFGYKFLDKIIQIPFRIPIGSRTSILAYIKDLLKIEADAPSIDSDVKDNAPVNSETGRNGDDIINNIEDTLPIDDSVEVVIEEIPTEENLNEITLKILEVAVTEFELNNPRSIKKFMNIFKLLTYIAYESKLLVRFQISPIQIGYYLVFYLNHSEELDYIIGFLQKNQKIGKVKLEDKGKIDEVIYSKMTSHLNNLFDEFMNDSDIRKFTIIRNLVGKSITS